MGRERFPGAQFHIEVGPKETTPVKAVQLDLGLPLTLCGTLGFAQLIILFISKNKSEKFPLFLKVVVGIK